MSGERITGEFSHFDVSGSQEVKGSRANSLNGQSKGFIQITDDDHPTDEAIMNKDGSCTIVTKHKTPDGGTWTKEVTYYYDKDGNKVLKSVKNQSDNQSGVSSEEFIDTDGDGYADTKITRTKSFKTGEETEFKRKYSKDDRGKDTNMKELNNRKMVFLSTPDPICYKS